MHHHHQGNQRRASSGFNHAIGNRRKLKRDAKDSLEQEEEFYVEEVRDHVFVGNRRGLDLAGLSTRVRALEDEVATQKEEITSHKIQIGALPLPPLPPLDLISAENELLAVGVFRSWRSTYI